MRGSWWWGCVLGLFLICAARPVRAERVEKDGWKLGGSHLVLSVERLATLAVWREVEQEWPFRSIHSSWCVWPRASR